MLALGLALPLPRPGIGNCVPLSAYTMPLKLQPASPELALLCQQRAAVLTPTGGTPAKLSLQLPG